MWQHYNELLQAPKNECIAAKAKIHKDFPTDPIDVVENGLKLAFERLNVSGHDISADSLKSAYSAMRLHLLDGAGWITGQPFIPVVGKQYEINFGLVTHQGKTGYWTAHIRADGQAPSSWIDLDTTMQLEPELARYVVQAFR